MTMERRFTKGAHVRASKSADKPGIQGYGAVFGEEYVLYEDTGWRFVEKINPGAFKRVLAEKQDTRCLFNHSADQVLGRTTNNTLRMAEDETGLSYENDLDMRTTVAQNVQAFVDRGDVTGCSFAFTVSKQTWREETSADGKMTNYTREIDEIGDLFDVGPVTYPAYTGTSVGSRSRSGLAEMRNQVLAIDGLPAEVRARLARKKGEGEGDGDGDDVDQVECNCRCVACARDKNCEACTDHMVDCGDEKNCACMGSRSANPIEILRHKAEVDLDARLRHAGVKVS